MRAGANGRRVDQRSKRDMDECTVAHDGIEERAAERAMRVVAVLLADDQQRFLTLGDAQLAPFDAGEGLERRTGGLPALGAVAVEGIAEFIRHGVLDRAAEAPSAEYSTYRHRGSSCFDSLSTRHTKVHCELVEGSMRIVG